MGACATFTDILESGEVKERAPLLCSMAREVGARQIRNRATIGGNVASGSPAGDSQRDPHAPMGSHCLNSGQD